MSTDRPRRRGRASRILRATSLAAGTAGSAAGARSAGSCTGASRRERQPGRQRQRRPGRQRQRSGPRRSGRARGPHYRCTGPRQPPRARPQPETPETPEAPQARQGRRMPPRPTWRLRTRARPARRPARPGTARSIARPAPSSPGSPRPRPRPRPSRTRTSWASERPTSASIPTRRPGSTSLALAWTRHGDRVCPATATEPGGTPARCPPSRDRHGHGRRCPRRLRTG